MESFTLTTLAWLAGGTSLFAIGVWSARRLRPARPAAAAPTPPPVSAGVSAAAPAAPVLAPLVAAGSGADTLLHRLELRMEAIEGLQSMLASRVETLGSDDTAERRLQAMAGQILSLVRDKNATLDTAMAGLDQLRARIRALEQMGEPAEARALLEKLDARIDGMETAQAGGRAALEARLAALETATTPFPEISDQLTRLYAQKDATVETVFARLAPLEAQLAEIAGRDAAPTLDRLAERLEALAGRVAGLEGVETSFTTVSDQLTRLSSGKDATVETVFARLAPIEAQIRAIEATLVAQNPQSALERFADRLETARQAQAEADRRIAALETAENPFAEISDQLTRLYAQKDATVAAVFVRLAPLEARLDEIDARLAAQDPKAALDRFATRLETLRAAQEAAQTALGTRVAEGLDGLRAAQATTQAGVERRLAALETAENPYAEISDQLARLYAQKDATVETVFSRLAPLETRLRTAEAALAAQDPQAALDRFAARLETLRGLQEAAQSAAERRLAALEEAENPYAEISDQLTRLYAQKDAAVATVFERLAPLEAKLDALEAAAVERDPRAALARLADRLDALSGRVAGLEGTEGAFAEITDQLARLTAGKDATLETLSARLAPLEAQVRALEAEIAARDPQAALDRFAARLETLRDQQEAAQAALGARVEDRIGAARSAQESALAALGLRLSALEEAENPFTEISDQLTRLYAQKDATVETVFARLAPLEAKLDAVEADLAGRDPEAALARMGERLEALQGRVTGIEEAENPFAEIADQLTRLYAQKDAAVETVFSRLAPVEAKLDALEASLAARDPEAALARVGDRIEALQARVAGLEGVENPFAEISDQLTRLYAQKDAAVATVFDRLAPVEEALRAVEARIAAQDPQAALDRMAERLAALQARVAGIETAENPFAEVSDQLARLYAQKDAAVETVFSRLAPVEAKLDALEDALAERDPGAALARLSDRLEALSGRVAGIETAENPFAEVSDQLARLYAQKDAAVETVFTRLAPLEAKLDEIEGALSGLDPHDELKRFAAEIAGLRGRLEGLEGADPLAEVSDQFARLYAQKDAAVASVLDRLAPLEARLAELERADADDDGAEAARAEAQAIAAQLVAARTVAEETRLFASRISLLEASLPRLTMAQALMMQALERQAAPGAAWPLGTQAAGASEAPPTSAAAPATAAPSAPVSSAPTSSAPAPTAAAPTAAPTLPAQIAAPVPTAPQVAARTAPEAEEESFWRLPRVVSVHKG